jgi:hypothetical protein
MTRPLDLVLARNPVLLSQLVILFKHRIGFRIARDATLQIPVTMPVRRELINEPEFRPWFPGEYP